MLALAARRTDPTELDSATLRRAIAHDAAATRALVELYQVACSRSCRACWSAAGARRSRTSRRTRSCTCSASSPASTPRAARACRRGSSRSRRGARSTSCAARARRWSPISISKIRARLGRRRARRAARARVRDRGRAGAALASAARGVPAARVSRPRLRRHRARSRHRSRHREVAPVARARRAPRPARRGKAMTDDADDRIEPELSGAERRALDAWTATAPPAGFADRVLAARASRRMPLRRRARATCASPRSAARSPQQRRPPSSRSAPRRDARRARRGLPARAHVGGDRRSRGDRRRGRRAARVDVAADGATTVSQPSGDVFYRVNHGGPFVVHTPAGDIHVTGTCFRIEVQIDQPRR